METVIYYVNEQEGNKINAKSDYATRTDLLLQVNTKDIEDDNDGSYFTKKKVMKIKSRY